MRRQLLFLFILLFISVASFGQKTKVYGKILDAKTKKPVDLARVGFVGSEISTLSEEDGSYSLEIDASSDSLIVSCFGYQTFKQKIQTGQSQEITVHLSEGAEEIEGVVIRMSGDSPAIRILKRVIRNKPVNNKEKLEAYNYEVYTKVQVDLNNIDKQLSNNPFTKPLDFVLEYLDSNEKDGKILPILLSENIATFYYKKNPPSKREITKATRVSGMDNLDFNELFGDTYMDINVYDNYINLFSHAFISPISTTAPSFYNYTLVDSMYIDNNFYFKIGFKPKRSGDATFIGTMLVHDTTFAIMNFTADLSSIANINYINGFYFEQSFKQIQNKIWMMTNEKLVIDFKLTKDSKLMGFYMRKYSERYNFEINQPKPTHFYNTQDNLEETDKARNRSTTFWDSLRPTPLNQQEHNIDVMLDTLNKNRTFKFYKNITILGSTGYYPINKISIGDLYSFIGTNPVERFRMSLALRTSAAFSKRIELGGRIGYGFKDQKIKGGATIRINLSKARWSLLSIYGNSDIEQYGTGTPFSSMFANLLRRKKTR